MTVSKSKERFLDTRNMVLLAVIYLFVCIYIASNQYFEPNSSWQVLGLIYGTVLLGHLIASMIYGYNNYFGDKAGALVIGFIILAVLAAIVTVSICLNVNVQNYPDGQVAYSSSVISLTVSSSIALLVSYLITSIVNLLIYSFRHRNDDNSK